ncbi:hypothetical protein WA158_005617 [Blastocystis sp. Blastoise]
MAATLPDSHRCIHITDTIEIVRRPEIEFNPEPTTIPKEFCNACKVYADIPAVVSKDDKVYTYADYYQEALKVSKALIALDLKPKDTVGAIGFNSPEYFFTCHGTWLSDCCPAGIYTTNNPEACYYVLHHCEAKVCLCQGGKQATKIASIRDRLPNLKAIVVYWPEDGMPEVEEKEGLAKIYTWEDFLLLGKDIKEEEVLDRVEKCQPGSCATLIYTSGTTGEPKGVMCSHDGCMTNALAIRKNLPLLDNERLISFLPLNHIAAQYVDLMLPCRSSMTMYLADTMALKGTLTKTLRKAKPTVFVAVPRVYEKMMEALKEGVAAKTGIVKFLTEKARVAAKVHCLSRQTGKKEIVPWFMSLYDKIVLSKIRTLLGFECCRSLVVSAAPVTEETLNFFASFDMPILDLLGQSEGTAPVAMNNSIGDWKIGACGKAVPGCQMRIGDNDEIQYRGRLTMMGYLKNPEETLKTLDPEGWIHTGDMGKTDEDGFFYVTGRIKELIVTAGGENIPPVYIENSIIELCPSISNIIVVGDKKKYLSCLIALKAEVDAQGEPTNKLSLLTLKQSQSLGSTSVTTTEVMNDPIWSQYINSIIEKYNNEKAISQAQKIRKWTLLEKDMSVGGGELTATMKLKRNVVHQHYHDAIEKMYSEESN